MNKRPCGMEQDAAMTPGVQREIWIGHALCVLGLRRPDSTSSLTRRISYDLAKENGQFETGTATQVLEALLDAAGYREDQGGSPPPPTQVESTV